MTAARRLRELCWANRVARQRGLGDLFGVQVVHDIFDAEQHVPP